MFCCRGCFLTSSLIATLALSLTIPLTMMADVLWKGVWLSEHHSIQPIFEITVDRVIFTQVFFFTILLLQMVLSNHEIAQTKLC